MLYHTLLSQLSTFFPTARENTISFLNNWWWQEEKRQKMLVFCASAFLVSIPVFFQAPLVRVLPWLSLLLTAFWFGLSWHWKKISTELLELAAKTGPY